MLVVVPSGYHKHEYDAGYQVPERIYGVTALPRIYSKQSPARCAMKPVDPAATAEVTVTTQLWPMGRLPVIL